VGEECQEMDVIKEDSRGRTTSTHDRMLLLLRRHGMMGEIVYGYAEEGDTSDGWSGAGAVYYMNNNW